MRLASGITMTLMHVVFPLISLRLPQVSRAGDVTLNTRGENGREFRGVSLGRI